MDMASIPNLLYAVSLGGRRRLLDHYSSFARLEDVARDGRALILSGHLSLGMAGVTPGDTRERDLAWLSFGEVTFLSPDGRTLLFTERAAGETRPSRTSGRRTVPRRRSVSETEWPPDCRET